MTLLDTAGTRETPPAMPLRRRCEWAAAVRVSSSGEGAGFGFGLRRILFSRSEHLARHIRRHTGERPFTSHCFKQISRLDNFHRHAQAVHADNGSEQAPEHEAREGDWGGEARAGGGFVAWSGDGRGMAQRLGTSTGYEGAATANPGYVDINMDEFPLPFPSNALHQRKRQWHLPPPPPLR
ncbi:hypothetical protein DFH08DRAFT_238264 [Mycena albidolilacea]|uniref:C2H2-type domain-containing protein n=1 Tax=Mycena albidolilacea TaxID=1033008 RepID=A0AAD7EPT7_9AGAR|nr:hypothetical protein DFH08DRAFT_238264 [Mycena albidolilacea]